jgi:predicted enzyme related to lactoylglutathione lyase
VRWWALFRIESFGWKRCASRRRLSLVVTSTSRSFNSTNRALCRRRRFGDLRTGGLSHFAVPNVAEFLADVQRRGARVVVPVTEFVPGVPVAFIADNAGNLIELISAVSTQKSGLGGESESAAVRQDQK